ncbi:integrase arm-type DNA-binding domain-containing protein [bacterium AH-315-O15]|nr:integrase arm-type DNA-binding domain-containing protein [bacterium AH-315-O15]
MTLTDRTIRSLKPRATGQYEVFDDTVPGLAIRVNSGSKSWVLFYRERLPDLSSGFAPGKRLRRLTLGTYPALSLASARTKAQRALSDLTTKGIDPAVGKREARNAESFGELAADYLERHAKPHKKSWKEDQRQLNVYVLPSWQTRPAKAITRKDVQKLLDPIAHRGKLVAYNRVKAVVSSVFKYGIDRIEKLDHNPAAGIKKQKETSRERYLDDDAHQGQEELAGLWRVLDAIRTGTQPTSPISQMLARGLQLMLRTAQRGGEIFTMEWSEVDEASGWWTIPGEKTKNGKTHRVPLTQAALALIAEARADGSGPDGLVFAGPEGRTLEWQAKKAVSKLRHAGLAGDYTKHDLRRTVATGLQALNLPTSTISHVLNQQEGGSRVTPIYARHDFSEEKTAALEAWGRHLDALLTGQPSRVVSFRQ